MNFMMTVGTSVSASGAEEYFKADFIKQEKLLKVSAVKIKEAAENSPIEVPAAAEPAASSSALKDSTAEDSDGENPEPLEDENSVAHSEPSEQYGSEKLQAKNLAAEDLSAEGSMAKKSSIGNPNIENSRLENPLTEKPTVAENKIDLAQMRTLWVGKLSEELELTGVVTKKDFAALARGVHPQTGEQFIRHVKPRTVTDERGKTRQTKSHRAGLDQTLNAPKSVSLVAPHDERVIAAHWRSAIKAVETIEEFTTAKMGNVKPPERTGKAAYAAFLHFEARPDFKNNFAAPDLHTHFFEFNFSRTADGRSRALETREIYRCQKLATAVYRTELLKEMTDIGYEMRIDGKTGAPEVASISRAYIEASSPRQTEIKRTAEELGIKSTKIVASNYRRGKDFDPVEMRRRWNAMDVEFGSQAAKAAEQARNRTKIIESEKQTFSSHKQIPDSPDTTERTAAKAAAAVDFVIAQAKEQKNIEVSKHKWITRQNLLTEALNFSPMELRIENVKAEFIKREKNGELREFEFDRRKTKLQSEITKTDPLKKDEIKLEADQEKTKSFENIYDKTGILQSRTGTSGSRREESGVTSDHTTGANPANRTFRDGEFGSGDNPAESNIISPITDDAALGSIAFGGSGGTDESDSNLTDFTAECNRENSDSAITDRTGAETDRTGAEQNPAVGERERELPNRSGDAGRRKSDKRQNTGRSVEESRSGGESDKSSFKPIQSVEIGNAVKAKPDIQPQTSEMEDAPRFESDAGVEKIKIAGTKSAPLRDYRTDDKTARGEQEVAGNNGSNFSTVEREGAENTHLDTEGKRRADRSEERNDESEDKHRKIEFGKDSIRTPDEFGETGIEDGDRRTGTLSNQIGESQVANGREPEGEGFVGSRISNGNQRATAERTSTSTK